MARPYPARLRSFTLVFCPSTWPELHGLDSPATKAVDQGVQRGQGVLFDSLHPLRQLVATQVAHHLGEVADVVGDRVALGTTDADLLEGEGVRVGEVAWIGHDPSDDATGPRRGPGRRRGGGRREVP